MRTIIFFLLTICSSVITHSQELAFSSVSLHNIHNTETIAFAMPREVNVRHYRIEASNDSVNFEVITTIPSKGNSVLAASYRYNLAGFSYKCYRIGRVEMSGGITYSNMVFENNTQQYNRQYDVDTDHTIARNQTMDR